MVLGSCTQQSDGIPDNRADASRNVLALGMGYIRLNDRDRPVKADCPYFRDTRRIEKFEELGYHVHSVNMQVSSFLSHDQTRQLVSFGRLRTCAAAISRPVYLHKHTVMS
jgi:hypothetical protein